MYRQFRQPQVQGSQVIDFLIRDRAFPRALACCVDQAAASCASLPRGEAAIAALAAVRELLVPQAEGTSAAAISQLMDDTQRRLGSVHQAVVDTWFLPGERG